jgi:hypothetical protein
MSSVGQAVGYIGGAIIGSFFGYPMLGAAIGGMIGGALDPPKGPKIEGPRLNDLSVQTSTYGAQIPVIKGQRRHLRQHLLGREQRAERDEEDRGAGRERRWRVC